MCKDKLIYIGTSAILIFFILVFLNSWSEDIVFYLMNRNSLVTENTKVLPNPYLDPVQEDLPESQKMFRFYTHGKTYFIDPKAKYSITGRILSKNMKLGMWGLSRYDFDYIALIDVVLGWNDISDIKLFEKNISYLKQRKSPGGGRYYYYYVPGDSIWTVDYVRNHTSHNHIIPASNNVMSVLYSIKKYDVVKMEGYLVDVYKDGNVVSMTSLSRSDTDGSSRARQNNQWGGSCEVFYVKSIQIGNKIYK